MFNLTLDTISRPIKTRQIKKSLKIREPRPVKICAPFENLAQILEMGLDPLITACKRSVRRLCFYGCVSVHRVGSTWAGTPPRQVHPPGWYTPSPGQIHPPVDTPQQVHPLAGTPSRRYTPKALHAGRYGQQAGGTHPT